jgi:hypothetical protein
MLLVLLLLLPSQALALSFAGPSRARCCCRRCHVLPLLLLLDLQLLR